MTDLLICGGSILDGTGAKAYEADLRVRGGRIVEIGGALEPQGETVLDATGAVVTPGFIDSHTHYDATMFWDGSCDPITLHGVTSVLMGNCSLGLAPARAEDRGGVADIFSYVEDIPSDLLLNELPWNWETFADYAGVLSGMELGLNAAVLVGHSMLRLYVMGDAAWERSATFDEIEAIASNLDASLAAGAYGMSSSFFDKDRHGRPVPSWYADDAEFEAIFQTLKRHNSIYQLVTRSPDVGEKLSDLDRIAGFARRYGVTVLDNGIGHFSHDPEFSENVSAHLRKLQASGAAIYSMMSPASIELVVNFDHSNCFISMPAWNDFIQTPHSSKRAKLMDQDWRARGRQDFDTATNTMMFPSDRISDLRIGAVGKPELENWIERSLQDLVDARGGHPSDVLADWLLENDLQTRLVHPLTNRDQDEVAKLLKRPELLISGSDAGAHLQMFCTHGDSTLLLTRYVRERKDFTLEAMIHQMTGRQADVMGMSERGRIAIGNVADLTIFALDELRFEQPKVIDDLPGGYRRFRRPAGGYRYTIVSGQVVQERGRSTGALPGRYLSGAAR